MLPESAQFPNYQIILISSSGTLTTVHQHTYQLNVLIAHKIHEVKHSSIKESRSLFTLASTAVVVQRALLPHSEFTYAQYYSFKTLSEHCRCTIKLVPYTEKEVIIFPSIASRSRYATYIEAVSIALGVKIRKTRNIGIIIIQIILINYRIPTFLPPSTQSVLKKISPANNDFLNTR